MSKKIRISHELDETSERTLVMKDRGVLDGDSDSDDHDVVEMEDINLAEKEKREALVRKKNHGRKFNPLTDDWDEQRGILDNYDDFDELEKQRARKRQLEVGMEETAHIGSKTPIPNSVDKYDDSVELPSSIMIGQPNIASGSQESSYLRFQSEFLEVARKPAKFKSVAAKKNMRVTETDEIVSVVPTNRPTEEDSELYAQLSRLRRMDQTIRVIDPAERIAQQIVPENTTAESKNDLSEFLGRIESKEEEAVDPVPSSVVIDEPMTSDPVPPPMPTDVTLRDHGLMGALQFFKSRGHLTETADPNSLERRDEYGKSVVDPKQAFKQLSWQFHGIKPGAKKQEKRIKKVTNNDR
jgi:hypothetical protein